MNFSSQSVKSKANARNEDCYFELATARGHIFIVLDFSSHDYTNLNETLKRRIESIVESFASLSGLSPQLLLGCIAQEINNCVHDLGHQVGGDELLCAAALCLLSDNQLVCLTYGDARINVFTGGQLLLLNGSRFQVSTLVSSAQGEAQAIDTPSEKMGRKHLTTPLTNHVQTLALLDEDVVLILTAGLEEGLTPQQRLNELLRVKAADANAICKELMSMAASKRNDRTLVVISGPYEQPVAPNWSDLQKSITSLTEQVSGLAENDQRRETYVSLLQKDLNSETLLEQRISQRIDAFKDEIRGKAGRIDLLESEEKLKRLETELAGKAETADVLALQRDILQFRIKTNEPTQQESVATKNPLGKSPTPPLSKTAAALSSAAVIPETKQKIAAKDGKQLIPDERDEHAYAGWFKTYLLSPLGLLMLLAAVGGVLIGVWVSGRTSTNSEAWVVKTSGDELRVRRQQEDGKEESFSVKLAQPFSSNGEQRFATFAEVQNYLDRVKASQAAPSGATAAEPAHQSTESGSAALATPAATSAAETRRGNSAPPATSSATAQTHFQRGDTAEILRGDTIATLAARYHVTQSKLRQLNPGIRRWTEIKAGQRVGVPSANSLNAPVTTPTPTARPTETIPAAGINEVTIGSGDSLERLARRHRVTTAQLKELNPAIKNWRQIRAGQKILIPQPASAQASPSPTK